MPPTPLARSRAPRSSALVDASHLETFLQQLHWIAGAAQHSKFAFTRWLLVSPALSAESVSLLVQARRLTTRHLAQLTLLLPDLPFPLPLSPSAPVLLARGDDVPPNELDPGSKFEGERPERLRQVVQQIGTYFSAVCTGAAQNAVKLGRIDLAVVLTSWSAGWKSLVDAVRYTLPAAGRA